MSEVSTSDKDNGFAGLRLPLQQSMRAPVMQDKNSGDYSYLGLPYRGSPLPFKNDDPAYKQPQYHFDVKVEQLQSTDEEDMKRWKEITQMVADGKAFISFEDKQYDPELKGWRVLIRWCEPHFDEPTEEPAI